MEIVDFDDLLRVARAQAEPQRLLFVFAGAELPDGATLAQQARFERGEGGALAPLMCVDKAPADITSFGALVDEAGRFGPAWAMVFVAALAGTGGRAPTDAATEEALDHMVESIKAGRIDAFIPFGLQGECVVFG